MLAGGLGCSRQPSAEAEFRSATELFQKGEFAAADKAADAGWRRYPKGLQPEWFWKFKLLRTEIDLIGAAGKARELLAEAPPGQNREATARYKMLLSYQVFREQHHQEAAKLVNAAIAEAHAIGAYKTEADAELLLAARRMYFDLERAEEPVRAALQIADSHDLKYERDAALLDLGMVRLKREHYGDAMPYFLKTKTLAEEFNFKLLRFQATQDLADCYAGVGDLERAFTMQSQAVEAANELRGMPNLLSAAYFELGNLHLENSDIGRAIAAFKKAAESVSPKNDAAQFAQSASGLAQALTVDGQLEQAEYYNAKAFEACDKQNPEQLAFLKLNEAAIAARRNQDAEAIRKYREALTIGQPVPSALWEAYAGLGREYAKAKNLDLASSNFEQALGEIEKSRADQLTSKYQIAFLSNLMPVYQEYVSILMKEGQEEKAIEAADSSRASVLARSINQEAVRSGRLVRDVQREAKLGNSVFLFYWLAPERSYLWVLTGDRTKTIELPDGHAIAQDVESYVALLVNEKRDPLATPSAAGKRLYQTLIEPAETYIPHGARVVIVPDGALHKLNFETLVSDKPTPHYWIEDAVIAVAPSLSILTAESGRPRARRDLLGLFGDPEPTPEYPRLPEAGAELENVEHHFPAAGTSVYQGTAATVGAYRNATPKRFSDIHFTAHAEANEQSPLDSAIILSPRPEGYKLYAWEVMGIPLTADLVTISGCRGAGSRTLSGEGLVGFAWAFFQAGARNVVTSLWEADDHRTAELMDRFYQGVQAGDPYAKALREAKLTILRTENSKPYYWAPFQLYTRDAPHS